MDAAPTLSGRRDRTPQTPSVRRRRPLDDASTPTTDRAGEWSARHESTRYRPDIAAQLCAGRDYQLKFVVAAAGDIDEIDQFLSDFGPHDAARVLLMPEGVSAEVLDDRKAWVKTLCGDRGYTFCPRMHIAWYGNRRGT